MTTWTMQRSRTLYIYSLFEAKREVLRKQRPKGGVRICLRGQVPIGRFQTASRSYLYTPHGRHRFRGEDPEPEFET